VRICAEADEHLMWKFMSELAIEAPPKPNSTLHEYIERYKRECVPKLAPRTQENYSRALARLDQVFGHMQPDEVRPKDIGVYLDRPKGKIAANRDIAVLSAVFAKMVGRWYVAERNPCVGVERNPSRHRDRYITDEEYAAVHAIASPRVRLAMDLALITGQRQGDLIALPFKNVTDDGILFRQGKTGKRLCVGWSEALHEVVARARALVPQVDIGGYVIRTKFGRPYASGGFRACWQRNMNRAMDKKAIAERFTFHDIRAKCVSDSKSLQEANERAGHQTMSMTKGTYDRGVRKVTPLK